MQYSGTQGVNILGLNLYFHDSATSLIRDGQLVASLEEERWFRDDKHTLIFPRRSIKYCLEFLDSDENLDHVAINMDPTRCLSNSPNLLSYGIRPSRWSRKHWLNYRDRCKACRDIQYHTYLTLREVGRKSNFTFHQIAHHDTHAASAFFVSPFDSAAILTVDANGEWPTTATWLGEGSKIRNLRTLGLPHSLGGLYGALTEFLGFRRNNDEFKVMGLAAYGDLTWYRDALNRLIEPTPDGFFRLNRDYFGYLEYKITPLPQLEVLFDCRRREYGSELTQQHKDIAAALQETTESIAVHMVQHLHQQTGSKNLCLAGGVCLNCVMNTTILERTGFENLFVQPASYDAGTALGAAFHVHHQILNQPRGYVLDRVDLGPEFSDEEIEAILREGMLNYCRCEDIAAEVAALLTDGRIVGWFQGRAEFGPRALGHRSILADPTLPHMQDHLNLRVKHREDFRPFAPASTLEDYAHYFDALSDDPFMTRICVVKEEWRRRLPAITHIDGTARLQTVAEQANPLFHRLIRKFQQIRGIPVVLNTSFNVNGEPMVLTPRDALRCFFTTGIDNLALGSFLIEKRELCV